MKSRPFISRLLLAIFVMVQMSVLHELQHDDTSQNCDVCIIAHDFQSTSFQLATTTTISLNVVIPVAKEKVDVYFAFAKASYLPSHLSIRPPPTV